MAGGLSLNSLVNGLNIYGHDRKKQEQWVEKDECGDWLGRENRKGKTLRGPWQGGKGFVKTTDGMQAANDGK